MQLTYEGPPALAGLFAQLIRDEGLQVAYKEPKQQRSAAEVVVAVSLTVTSTVAQIYGDEIKAAVRKLKMLFPHTKVADEDGHEIE